MDLAILIRGQSNAWLFSTYGAPALVASRAEALLGFDGRHDRIVVRGGPGVTEFGATALVGPGTGGPAWMAGAPGPHWSAGPFEAKLLGLLGALTPAERAVPMLTLWMHNEGDSGDPTLTTAEWLGAVRADAALVRHAVGQGPVTTPYLFVWVPFDFGTAPAATALVDAGSQKIRAGMQQLAADPGFGARMGPQTGDLDMDGLAKPGAYGGLHMSRADGLSLVDRLGRAVADAFAGYAKPGSPEAAGRQAVGPAAGSARVTEARAGIVEVRISGGLVALTAAAAVGAGWVLRGEDGSVRVPGSVRIEDGGLVLDFGGALPAGSRLYYGYGHGRIDVRDGKGEGSAVTDGAGLGLTAPLGGMPVG